MNINKILQIVFISIIMPCKLYAGTAYYVDCSRPTDGDGTYASPWNSLVSVNNHAFADGDDIYFKFGTTCILTPTANGEKIDIDWSGDSGDTAVIGCYDGNGDFDCTGNTLPILQGNLVGEAGSDVPMTTYRGIIQLRATSGVYEYITIRELHIKNTGGYGVYISNNTSNVNNHITITKCTIDKFDRGAIMLAKAANSTISYNEVSDGPINVPEAGTIVVNGAIGNGGTPTGLTVNNTIEYNVIYQCRECIDIIKGAKETIVQYNTIYDPHDMCIYVDGAKDTIIRYNLMYLTTEWNSGSYDRPGGGFANGIYHTIENARDYCWVGGLEIYGNFMGGLERGIRLSCAYCYYHAYCWQDFTAYVYSNTMVDHSESNIMFGSWNASSPNLPDIEIKNNISRLHTAGGVHTNSDSPNGVVWSHNLYYPDSIDTVGGNADDNAIEGANADPMITKTSGWRSLAPNSITPDDFRLSSTDSAAYNAGIDLGDSPYNLDYWGTNRDTNAPWDIGAHEYNNGGNTAPIVDAGIDQSITLPTDTVNLDGTVTDDGLPNPPGTVTYTWTKISGPGTVTFADENAVDTAASFSAAGTYMLRLTADDSDLQESDDITITVNSDTTPPAKPTGLDIIE